MGINDEFARLRQQIKDLELQLDVANKLLVGWSAFGSNALTSEPFILDLKKHTNKYFQFQTRLKW